MIPRGENSPASSGRTARFQKSCYGQWRQLKAGQRLGFDFDRQKPVDRYIIDFLSHELMLAIEIDGDSHTPKGPEDDRRQERLESLGIRFLRFDDKQVKTNLDGVVLAIGAWI
ncbi:MAG: endonuclease domain-containing protein [Verrucomicrobiota bacterium]